MSLPLRMPLKTAIVGTTTTQSTCCLANFLPAASAPTASRMRLPSQTLLLRAAPLGQRAYSRSLDIKHTLNFTHIP